MKQGIVRSVVVLFVAAAALALPVKAFAQADEIQVYDGGLAPKGVFNLTLHNNFTPKGLKTPTFATREFTDDASLVQDAGGKIISVTGSTLAFKITVPSDLAYAAKLFSAQRTGIGTDVHRFSSDPTKPLYLGTLHWEGEPGLDGHSDGDRSEEHTSELQSH